LSGYSLGVSDGEIGKVKDFYFDDKFWTIRYLVMDTGSWLVERKVLISPYAVSGINTDEKVIGTRLTKKQIENSPSWDADKPVSRQYEIDYYGYYGWPAYWYGPYAWGPYYYPYRERQRQPETTSEEQKWDPNLRSSSEVSGYNVQAEDGEIGHVADFIINNETWRVRYLIIDTKSWWPGGEVLLPPQWAKRVSWNDHKVFVTLGRETIKQAPEYDKQKPVSRDYEDRLHRYYKREGYWASEPKMKKQPVFEKNRS
jgi:uncharacterized protein YrrD